MNRHGTGNTRTMEAATVCTRVNEATRQKRKNPGRKRRRPRRSAVSLVRWLLLVAMGGVACQETTETPTSLPSESIRPTVSPTISEMPTVAPPPTVKPLATPTFMPTLPPSGLPVTESPSRSDSPSSAPTWTSMPSLSSAPSLAPTISMQPTDTKFPSLSPTISAQPSLSSEPTKSPTRSPSDRPSQSPSVSLGPTTSVEPSSQPSVSLMPTTSAAPSAPPSISSAPSESPMPSSTPSTSFPTTSPSESPTGVPSVSPSDFPSKFPSPEPSCFPSSAPTRVMTNVSLPDNFMTIQGMDDLTPGKQLIWAGLVSDEVVLYWNERPFIDIVVSNVRTVVTKHELLASPPATGTNSSLLKVTKTYYNQNIFYSLREDLGDDVGEILASRPFLTDFQRFAEALAEANLATTSLSRLVEIQIGDGKEPKSKSDNTGKVVGSIVGVTAFLLLLIGALYCYKQRQHQKRLATENYLEYNSELPEELQGGNVILPQDASQNLRHNAALQQSSQGPSAPEGSSDVQSFSIAAQSYSHVGGNVSELSFHSDNLHDDEEKEQDGEEEKEEEEEEEEEDETSESSTDDEGPLSPAFDMQISAIDDLEDDM